jgi:hypothetical protein
MHGPLWIGLLLGVIAYVTCGASAQSQALPGNTQKTARIALAQEFVVIACLAKWRLRGDRAILTRCDFGATKDAISGS